MNDERFDERRVILSAVDVLEKLTSRLNAGDPIPNALLGDAVEALRAFADDRHRTDEHEFAMIQSGSLRPAAPILVGEMQLALEALERGEAGAAGAFVTPARACIKLLREHAGVEPASQRYSKRAAEPLVVPDSPRTTAHASMLGHFQRLLERYARWDAAGVGTGGSPAGRNFLS